MVNSLQSIVLYSVPIAMLFDLLQTLWHLPIRRDCLRALFRRCTHKELRDLAKTLPWDHPVARNLDHEVHRRRMAGEFYGFHFFRVWAPFFPYTIFFLPITDVFPGIDFVFNISLSSAITLLFRYAFPSQEQPLDPRPHCLLINGLAMLPFFVDSHTILSTHRVHGTSAAWCFLSSIVQWYTGSGVPLPFPNPVKLLCCRCYLNFRRASDLHVPCYWCEMLQGMGYPSCS